MPKPDDHEDVSLELRKIINDRKIQQKSSYIYIAISFPINAIILSIIIYFLVNIFDNVSSTTIVVISSVSYAVAVIGSAISILYSRIARMEMHALTLHNEILKNRDRISDDCVRYRG
jgi:membrane associated rhomboid family serine protease